MAKILVIGGFPDEQAPVPKSFETTPPPDRHFLFSRAESRRYLRTFARLLADEIIERDHVLLGGCQSELDKEVAEEAEKKAKERNKDPGECVISYVGANADRVHKCGRILQSELAEWNLITSRLQFPEPVEQADAVVVLGGFDGTLRGVNWARLAGKPILPLAAFGLAAREVYRAELERFDERYAGLLKRSDYEQLNVVASDMSDAELAALARRTVRLAEHMISSSDVFVVMSFSDDGALQDAYETFVATCKEQNFIAFKVDHHIDESRRIVDEIMDSIHRCAFVIADVTMAKPNVYYELGYARAIGKPVIVTAKFGTRLPFDVYDVPTLFWKNQTTLREGLEERIAKIGKKLGRPRPAKPGPQG